MRNRAMAVRILSGLFGLGSATGGEAGFSISGEFSGEGLVSSGNEPVRVQCAFIDTPEIEELTDFIGSQKGYADAMHLPEFIDGTNDQPSIANKFANMFEMASRPNSQSGSCRLATEFLAEYYDYIRRNNNIAYSDITV